MYQNFLLVIFIMLFVGAGCTDISKIFSVSNSGANVSTQEKQITINTAQIVKEFETYSIDIEYPQISQPLDSAVVAFNAYMKNLIENQFVTEFSKRALDSEVSINNGKYTFGGTYEIILLQSNHVAVRMNFSEYLGGVHPTTWIYTVDYILEDTGILVDLNDLFVVGESEYLSRLSNLSQTYFTEKMGEISDNQWIVEGTKPIKTNFKNFNLSLDGLRIVFDEYQVAPYAAGPQTIIIPYSELRDIVDPSGPIRFIK